MELGKRPKRCGIRQDPRGAQRGAILKSSNCLVECDLVQLWRFLHPDEGFRGARRRHLEPVKCDINGLPCVAGGLLSDCASYWRFGRITVVLPNKSKGLKMSLIHDSNGRRQHNGGCLFVFLSPPRWKQVNHIYLNEAYIRASPFTASLNNRGADVCWQWQPAGGAAAPQSNSGTQRH